MRVRYTQHQSLENQFSCDRGEKLKAVEIQKCATKNFKSAAKNCFCHRQTFHGVWEHTAAARADCGGGEQRADGECEMQAVNLQRGDRPRVRTNDARLHREEADAEEGRRDTHPVAGT